MSTPQFYDRHRKALPQQAILAVLRLALPELGEELTPWQTELIVPTSRRVDQAYLAPLGDRKLLVHPEYQSTLDEAMPERIFAYDTDLERVAHQHFHQRVLVVSVVIWTCDGQTPEPVYHQEVQGLVVVHKEYLEIHLTQVDWHQMTDPLVLVLAPYFQTVTAPDLLPIADQMYRGAPVEIRDQLLGTLLALGQYRFGSLDEILRAILAKVGKTMDEIFQAISESDIGLALLERGQEQGKEIGKEIGLEQGKEAERRHGFGRRWRRRFRQEIDAALLDRIVALPQDRYDAVFDAVEDGVLTIKQILAMLDGNSSS